MRILSLYILKGVSFSKQTIYTRRLIIIQKKRKLLILRSVYNYIGIISFYSNSTRRI
jgi:hypothetical protein